MKRQLSTKDWELLSSYLDDMLNPREKSRVEMLLSTQPEYKEALEGLRRTKTILHRAPVRKVPRNFTLTAADVQPVKAFRWLPTMQWSSAAAALIAVFLFAYQLVPGFSGALTTASQKSADSELNATGLAPTESADLAAPMAAAESAAALPEVIYWGGPPLPVGPAMGMGGGGGGGGDPCSYPGAICGGGAGSGPPSGVDLAPTEMPFPQPPIPNTLPNLQTQPTEVVRIAAKEPITGTGPILGVRPDEQRGQKLAESTTADAQAIEREGLPAPQPAQQPGQVLLFVAAGLLFVAIALMVTAILLKRKLDR
jgi:hypothetical protein